MFYLDNILKENRSNVENIMAILCARGFLIDQIEGRYYLSDNASVRDADYLAKLMDKYKLGHIQDNKDYTVSSRRDWYSEGLNYNYKYKSIKPQTIEIFVEENVKLEDAMLAFDGGKRYDDNTVGIELKWQQFVLESLDDKVCVSILEPYVAFYVKAVSVCGVFTSYSCDGNHRNGGKIFVYADYPSNIWHEYLWKYIVCPEFGQLPFIGIGIRYDNEKSKRQVFQTVNKIAEYLYLNRKRIRAIKEKTVASLTKKYLQGRDKAKIEAFYRQECERVFEAEKP